MSEWKEVKLNDVCELIVDCPHSTAPDEGHGYPLIRTPNIGKGRLILDGVHRVSKDIFDTRNARAVPKPYDLIFAREATAGNVAQIQEGQEVCLGQRTVLIRPNQSIVDSSFLTYLLLAPLQQHNLVSSANGATVAHVNLPTIRNLKISIPELPLQKKLGSILASYDNLIENYQRQIKLLEEAAQRLYKEWFVDLRFPGWEETKIVDGTPEGWRCGRADEFFEITIGKTPPRSEKKWFTSGNNGIPWVSISDMGVAGMYIFITDEGITKESVEQFNMKIVPPGTVLLSFKLTVGRVSITTIPMCTNEAIAHFIIHNPKLAEYTYLYLRNFEYDTLGNTSSISKAVNSTIIKSMKFIMPRSNILEGFSAKLSPIMKLIYNKKAMCIKLSESRDRLLPKLMTGEIEV